ncbi:hypothetical protein [Marinobacter qingdaonensis]|uniref:Lipoprotein n=1 Tax=Marinobacter qingdaonensis TaxID=3108486 RepID=A0ABU5NUT1_9GAMM|nr:hypothetical protein [Marinobacter sp. ASW11-75]MEA1079575.1 hypothetical protein [Marinobacter sp. ASW11-75]
MQINPANLAPDKKTIFHALASTLALLLLAGCGGSGGSSSVSASGSSTPQTEDAVVAAPTSTALAENKAPEAFQFGNFKTVAVVLDADRLAGLSMSDNYVLKASDGADNVYRLSSFRVGDSTSFSFSLPTSSAALIVEIFSVSEGGQVFTEEFLL